MTTIRLRTFRGLTLIELLVAVAISAILIAAIYRTFIGQHKTYTIQEQVVDMQQNARVAISRMMREIRMAGFGNLSSLLPIVAKNGPFNSIINPIDGKNSIKGQYDDEITIIGAFEKVSVLARDHVAGENVLQLSTLSKNDFDPATYRRYVCVGGLESLVVTGVDQSRNELALDGHLINSHRSGTPIFKIKAITYRLNLQKGIPVLEREDNTDGGGGQDIAENIENLQLRYLLEDGSEVDSPADPSKIRMVKVAITARTSLSDPDFIGGEGGFRRRTISSNILVRNKGINP